MFFPVSFHIAKADIVVVRNELSKNSRKGRHRFVALAIWLPDKTLAKTCADFSDLEIGPDGCLYLLSDKSSTMGARRGLVVGGRISRGAAELPGEAPHALGWEVVSASTIQGENKVISVPLGHGVRATRESSGRVQPQLARCAIVLGRATICSRLSP